MPDAAPVPAALVASVHPRAAQAGMSPEHEQVCQAIAATVWVTARGVGQAWTDAQPLMVPVEDGGRNG